MVYMITLTLPVRDTSPVIARFCLIGLFIASESKAVMIVQPADGPSLGVAPSGTCKWMEFWWKNLFSGSSLCKNDYNIKCYSSISKESINLGERFHILKVLFICF